MNYNYHTHSLYCHHATGEPYEYIENAIKGGIKYMGFSDHIPRRKNGEEDWYRVEIAKASEYMSLLCEMREKYKKDIEIKIGFESEYYRAEFDNMLAFAKSVGCEYLILGHHYILSQGDGSHHTTEPCDKAEDLEIYVSEAIEGMKTGYFSYMAHPDIYKFTGDDDIYKNEAFRLCSCSKELGIPLEINFLGIREKRHYPNADFWEVAGEVGCPVTFGMDAHTPSDAADLSSFKEAMEFAEKYNLNYIGKPDIILL